MKTVAIKDEAERVNIGDGWHTHNSVYVHDAGSPIIVNVYERDGRKVYGGLHRHVEDARALVLTTKGTTLCYRLRIKLKIAPAPEKPKAKRKRKKK